MSALGPALETLWDFLTSTFFKTIWWATMPVAFVFLPHTPLVLRVAFALTSAGLVTCVPEMARRTFELDNPFWINPDAKPSVRLFFLKTVQQSLVVLAMAWFWTKGSPASVWFFYPWIAFTVLYAGYECANVAMFTRRVHREGVKNVAKALVKREMAKEPTDPFREVYKYIVSIRDRTDVHERVANEMDGIRSNIIWRLKEFQVHPNG